MYELLLKDETLSGDVSTTQMLKFEQEEITVKDVIEKRVYQEVENYNKTKEKLFFGLVQPTDAERLLNGYKMKKGKSIDAEQQFYIACDGFLKNGFFMLAGGQQLETLEQTIKLKEVESVSFIKLTPLVGG